MPTVVVPHGRLSVISRTGVEEELKSIYGLLPFERLNSIYARATEKQPVPTSLQPKRRERRATRKLQVTRRRTAVQAQDVLISLHLLIRYPNM